MGRKKASEMTPAELKASREYMREAKRESRKGKPPENDPRGYRNRAEYQRERRAQIKADNRAKAINKK